MDKLTIEGKTFSGYTIKTTNVSMLMINGANGMLACGYISMPAADKFGDSMATVTGVSSYDDMLNKPVVAVSKAAEALGARVGMTGKAALLKFA